MPRLTLGEIHEQNPSAFKPADIAAIEEIIPDWRTMDVEEFHRATAEWTDSTLDLMIDLSNLRR